MDDLRETNKELNRRTLLKVLGAVGLAAISDITLGREGKGKEKLELPPTDVTEVIDSVTPTQKDLSKLEHEFLTYLWAYAEERGIDLEKKHVAFPLGIKEFEVFVIFAKEKDRLIVFLNDKERGLEGMALLVFYDDGLTGKITGSKIDRHRRLSLNGQPFFWDFENGVDKMSGSKVADEVEERAVRLFSGILKKVLARS